MAGNLLSALKRISRKTPKKGGVTIKDGEMADKKQIYRMQLCKLEASCKFMSVN